MSLSQGNKSLWEDIKTLYNALNVERQRFGYTTVSVPELTNNKMEFSQITNLKDAIEVMSSHENLGSIAITNMPSSSRGNLITTDPFPALQTTLNNIRAGNATNFGFRSHNGTNFGHNGTNFGHRGHRGTNFGFDGSNFGHRGSNFGHRSHRSGDFSHRSHRSHRGTNFSHKVFRSTPHHIEV